MIVDVIRNPLVESRHLVSWVVADAKGRAVDGEGDVTSPVFLRSASKPFQAMAVIVGGAADAYGFTPEEIAVIGASHHGEPVHLALVRSVLEKSGVPESALQCGAHMPYNSAAAKELKQNHLPPTPLHNNCSGKHAGLLALSRHLGAPLEGYLERGHPSERIVFNVLSAFCGLQADEVAYGVDGCGLPAAAVSLTDAGMGFARFASSAEVPAEYGEAAARLRAAQTAHPVILNGTEGFNTHLIQAAPHLVAKSGAEGVFCVGHTGTGEGLALKVADGNNRAVTVATVALLRRMGWLDDAAYTALAEYQSVPVRNVAGRVVGEIRPEAT